MALRKSFAVIGGSLLMLSGCKPQEPTATDAPIPVAKSMESTTTGPPQPSRESTEKTFAKLTLTIPAGWTELPPKSEFIMGEYRLDGSGGAARLTVSSAGGDVEGNLERWQGQFTRGPDDPEPLRQSRTVAGREAVVQELAGTFRDGFSGGEPQRDWRMLGVVITTGPSHYFIKLTGPRDTITEQRERFDQLLASARLAD